MWWLSLSGVHWPWTGTPFRPRRAIDRLCSRGRSSRPYREIQASWLMLVMTLRKIMLTGGMPPTKNRVYIVESGLLRFGDLTHFDLHFARIGQFNLFRGAKNPIFVYRVDCLRHISPPMADACYGALPFRFIQAMPSAESFVDLGQTFTPTLPQPIQQVHIAAGPILVAHRHAIQQRVGESSDSAQCTRFPQVCEL